MGHYIPSDPSVDEIERMELMSSGGAGSGSGPDTEAMSYGRPARKHLKNRNGRDRRRLTDKLKKKIVRKKPMRKR